MYGGEDERGSQAEAAHGGVARQVAEVSFAVHNILASIADEEEERFATILTPTPGRSRWTPDEAKRRTGRQVAKPVTPLEKISAIHTLAKNEEVAATVTGDLLRRSAVVAQVKPEDKVRAAAELSREDDIAAALAPGHPAPSRGRREGHPGRQGEGRRGTDQGRERRYRGDHGSAASAGRRVQGDGRRHRPPPGQPTQVECGQQAREDFERNSPGAPAIRAIDRSVEFLDLVTACHAFVAASGRVVPGLRDRQVGDDERVMSMIMDHSTMASCMAGSVS
jgi:hypothetical protein